MSISCPPDIILWFEHNLKLFSSILGEISPLLKELEIEILSSLIIGLDSSIEYEKNFIGNPDFKNESYNEIIWINQALLMLIILKYQNIIRKKNMKINYKTGKHTGWFLLVPIGSNLAIY